MSWPPARRHCRQSTCRQATSRCHDQSLVASDCAAGGTISKRDGAAAPAARSRQPTSPERQSRDDGQRRDRLRYVTARCRRRSRTGRRCFLRRAADQLFDLNARVADRLQPLLPILLQASREQGPHDGCGGRKRLPIRLLAHDRHDRVGDILALERARCPSASRTARTRTPRCRRACRRLCPAPVPAPCTRRFPG